MRLTGMILFLGVVVCGCVSPDKKCSQAVPLLRVAQSDSERFIMERASIGDFEPLRRAFSRDEDWYFIDRFYKRTVFHEAVRFGDSELVRNLLPKADEALFGARDRYGLNVYHYAVRLPDSSLLAELLKKDKNNVQQLECADDRDGFTPFFEAVAYNRPDNLKLLLEQRLTCPDMSSEFFLRRDRFGRKPAVFAAVFGKHACLQLFLEAQRGRNDDRVMDCEQFNLCVKTAAERNDAVLARMMMSSVDSGAFLTRFEQGVTPLMMASALPDSGVLSVFLQKNPPLNAVDSDGNTLLHFAARENALACLNELLKRLPAEALERRNRAGETPLFICAKNGFDPLLKALYEAGADVNAVNAQSLTPLAAAAKYRLRSTVELLIEEKADIQKADDCGMNAAMYAAENIAPEIVRILLREGININQKDVRGRYLQDVARKAGCDSVEQMLENHDF